MAFINPCPAIPVVPLDPDLTQPLSFGPTQPIVMFPVRLETRFSPLPDGGADLRVRVYPDKVHIDTHEPELTEQEIIWGKHFWEQMWRAANDEEAQKIAWRQLAERFDAKRAAWVARALTPLNPEDRPGQPVAGERPLPAIKFPSTGTKNGAWTRAPMTRVLPKRWYVFGYASGKLTVRALGNPIPDQLATGPDPNASNPHEAPSGSGLAIDDGMKWMVDYAEAEKVGMGIRMRLNKEQAQGFDFLLVFGTKAAPGLTDATADLAHLFGAHHYTDGLAFVLQGTPSNNTLDAPSGFSTSDPAQEASYRAEWADTIFKAGDGSNADALTNALGLRNGNALTFANLAHANGTEQQDARHMNRALWAASWGYFLGQMLSISMLNRTTLTPDDINWARQHFIDYVRASGPLPAVRIGKQPYGILPVTSLNLWKPKAGQEIPFSRDVAVRDFLVKLREIWRANVGQVPRVGRSENPDRDFAQILNADGVSSGYAIRHLMGESYLQKLWSTLDPGAAQYWWNSQQQLTKAGLTALGLNWNHPSLMYATYSGWYAPLGGPIIQAGPLSEYAPLAPNYIDLLLAESDIERIHSETFAQFQPKGLLYSVLRHGMLLEYWNAAINLQFGDERELAHWVNNREQELVGPPAFTGLLASIPNPWELMSRPVNDPVGRYLASLRSSPTDPKIASCVATVLEFRESLEHLKFLSTAKLERLFSGTLDLCSHRLDAWITSFATKRLAEMRKANPTGILVGGYGWVMNLKPGAAPALETPPVGEQGSFYRPANNPGYTHTPSLAQAATVAVLRSGHLTHSDPTTKDLLAIDLSSERVRLAKWLLDGVRQGQPLGALLGYRFERRLQDSGFAEFITYFREISPLVARKLPQTADQSADQSPVEAIAANNVVDGLVLNNKWKNIPSQPMALQTLFGELSKADYSKVQADLAKRQEAALALQTELSRLDDAVDALSDALLAESVHHSVQGNFVRSANTLDAIASGEAPPPQLEVMRTPRTGASLTHRLIVLFSGSPTMPPEWASSVASHRANAEPHLNAWAAKFLGNPSRARCVIERLDAATNEVQGTKELRLNELQLSALDLIYAGTGTRDAQPSEVEQRILYVVQRRADGFAPGTLLRINPGRGPAWPTSDLSYGEYSELLRTARQLITGARGIDGSEMNLPEKNQPPAVNVTELEMRADNAAKALRETQADLQKLLDQLSTSDLELLREAILRSAQFGVAGSVPFSVAGNSPADRQLLLLQGNSIARELAQRVQQLTALEDNFKPATATDDDKRIQQLARVHSAFGSSFVVMPLFSPGNAVELGQAFIDSAKVQDNDALAVVTWFQRASRVREGVSRLDVSIRYAEALETGEKLNLRVVQLPYSENDRWVGLPLKTGQGLSPSRYSLVVQSPAVIDVNQPMAGLLIDEWVEVVPNPSETTGLVFQYDQPDAVPPQCILLAVPPDLDQPWNLWSLQQVLLETLDLARIRAVDPATLSQVGHYLPALYFAANAAGETISTDFLKSR